jgi:DsbC/DsbD-like thiol-disulfide interchange protein
MLLTGPFQRSLSLFRAGWGLLLLAVLVFSSPSVFAFQSFEEFSRSQNENANVTVTALTDPIGATPGKAFDLHLLVTVSEGWHIYALEAQGKNESLATQIRFEENVFQATGEWREPKPIIAMDGALDKVVKVHKDSTRFRRNLIVPGDLKPGTYTISGNVEFRSCDNKICSLPRKVGFKTRFQVSSDVNGL